MSNRGKVYIILVNYNGWADTLECLESLCRNEYGNWQAVIVDNNSENSSAERIEAWAQGALDVWIDSRNALKKFSHPPVPKPVPLRSLYSVEVGKSGGEEGGAALPIVLIRSEKNSGFSGGNNIGLKYVKARGDADYIWLLNNDTVIVPESLRHLVDKSEQLKTEGRRVGLIGSQLLQYHAPSKIQSLGGRYVPFTGKTYHIGAGEDAAAEYQGRDVVDSMTYIHGASTFMGRDLFDDLGFLSEDYFLYYEEVDLAVRATRRNWDLLTCMKAVVYHKGGSTIMGGQELRGSLGDYHYLLSRMVVTRKHYRRYMPNMYLGLILAVINRIRRGQADHIKIVFRVFRESLRMKV